MILLNLLGGKGEQPPTTDIRRQHFEAFSVFEARNNLRCWA